MIVSASGERLLSPGIPDFPLAGASAIVNI